MSQAFSSYQTRTGWNCITGCGRCCLNPEVEASPLEMLPMAFKLQAEGTLEEWIHRLEDTSQSHCLAYLPGEGPGQGKCGQYETRPSLCRMFGVAGYYDKSHSLTLSICRDIKEEYAIRQIPTNLKREDVPMMADWSLRLNSLHPDLLRHKMPINQALHEALLKVSLYSQYQEDSK